MHVLVIDVEYLVALEAEQLLTEQLSATVEIVPPRDGARALREAVCDVLFLDAALLAKGIGDEVRRLHDAGAGLVFSSVDNSHRHGLTDFPGIPVVSRPFDDRELVAMVRHAACNRRQKGRSAAEGP